MLHPKLLAFKYVSIASIRNAALALMLCIFAPIAANAQSVTIAALGDSLTAGYGLPPEDGLVPQLEAWLKANGQDATVINAGVSGDTTAGGLSRLDWTLTPDVQALIVTLGGNDMLRGLPPSESRANLEAIVKDARDRGLPVLLVAMSAPSNFGPDYKAEFDATYPDLAKTYDTLLYPSFFAPLLAQSDDPAILQTFMQPDGIHPNAKGAKIIAAGLGPMVQELIAAIPN
jgi:acyl-CoA thioesterase-1